MQGNQPDTFPGKNHWRADYSESCTISSEGGRGKRTQPRTSPAAYPAQTRSFHAGGHGCCLCRCSLPCRMGNLSSYLLAHLSNLLHWKESIVILWNRKLPTA